jgi:hypothetical protein
MKPPFENEMKAESAGNHYCCGTAADGGSRALARRCAIALEPCHGRIAVFRAQYRKPQSGHLYEQSEADCAL